MPKENSGERGQHTKPYESSSRPPPATFYRMQVGLQPAKPVMLLVKADVEKSLAQGTWYAATTDLWTSESGARLPYSFFYPLPHPGLATGITQFIPEDHSAHNIREFFENMLEEWAINKKDLVCITTDNVTNMVKAFDEFPDLWLGCFAHNLNMAISKALKILS
ncbi:hypothetical protein MHYP_G00121050 [Metynnis hypsauchen]